MALIAKPLVPCQSIQAAIADYHSLGDLSTTESCSHSSGGGQVQDEDALGVW